MPRRKPSGACFLPAARAGARSGAEDGSATPLCAAAPAPLSSAQSTGGAAGAATARQACRGTRVASAARTAWPEAATTGGGATSSGSRTSRAAPRHPRPVHEVTTANGTASTSGPQNSSAHSRADSGASARRAATAASRTGSAATAPAPPRATAASADRAAVRPSGSVRPAEQAQHEQRLRHRHDRRQDERKQQLDQARDRDAPAAAIGAAQRRREQHLGDARELGREHHRHAWSRAAPSGSHAAGAPEQTGDWPPAADVGERRPRSRGQTRRSENRIQAGPDTYIRIASQSCSRPMACRPGRPTRCRYCQLPWHQRRSRLTKSDRVGGFSSKLPVSSGSTRTCQPARRISTASTWSWLSTRPPSGGRPGSSRQPAMRHERSDADQRVVAPIRPAVALPPGAADRVGPHAVAHAELEDARERAGARQADDQLLQDADLGVRLHDPHQPHDRRARHHAVGIEHEHVIEPRPWRSRKSQRLPVLWP